MSNENSSIHDFDFNLICEYYSSIQRQGPGSPEVTIKALSFTDNLTDKSLIADIGCGSIEPSRLPRGRALPPEEIRALFGACEADDSSIGVRDAAMLGVILGCGLRRSEAVGLDLCDIVTDERALRVLGKGNKERLAYMPAGTWQRLRKWIDDVRGEKDGPLFTRIRRFDTLTNDRLTDQTVYHVLQVRQRLAGIAKCAPHDLRRTFATSMLDNGEDLITVKDAMGHASVTTTQQYDRRGEARLRTARDSLNLTDI